MKTFQQFILEAYDPEVQGRSQIRRQGEGGRVGADRRKTKPEKRRVKAAGGGKTTPAKDYKPRKASCLTQKERHSLYKKGERALRDLRLKNLGKKKESELKHPISSSGYKGYKKK